MKNFTNKEIEEALKNAPQPVQDEIAGGEGTADIIVGIGGEFKLHIDQMGKIAELTRNMLLGLITPQEFLQELLAAKIPEAESKQIMVEINQKIFLPIFEEMRKGGKSALEPTPPTPPPGLPRIQVPVPPAAVRAPAPGVGGAPAGVPGHFHLENKLPNYAAPSVVMPSSAPQQSEGQGVPTNLKLLEDREEPHIDIKMDKTAVPPNLPGVLRPLEHEGLPPSTRQPKTEPAPNVEPISPVQPAAAPSVPAYSVDPYRERIEP